MKTIQQLIPLCALLALAAGCGRNPEPPAPSAPTAPAPDRGGKPTAPVDVQLSSSRRSGQVDVIFSVRATGDTPNGLVHFVVPPGIRIVKGKPQVELGALHAGDTRRLELTLEVPARGTFRVTAGVDVQMSPGIKLHKSALVALGEAVVPREDPVVRLPEGQSVRTGQAGKAN